jgi:hypothetical protein
MIVQGYPVLELGSLGADLMEASDIGGPTGGP